MDNKEKQKEISSFDFDKETYLNDYKLLVQKLKSIRKNIDLLEKNFLDKEN